MKRKWICIVGAALLAPIVLALVCVVMIVIFWAMKQFIIVEMLFFGVCILPILVIMWWVLYIHCEEYWNERKNNKSG